MFIKLFRDLDIVLVEAEKEATLVMATIDNIGNDIFQILKIGQCVITITSGGKGGRRLYTID